MRLFPTTAAACLTLASSVCAQSIGIGPGQTRMTDRDVRVQAPEPLRAGQALVMHTLPVRAAPPRFYLTYGTAGRAGPFDLTDGAAVGSRQAAYTLRLTDERQRFTLHADDAAHTVYGPFEISDGAAIQLAGTAMTLRRVPPYLTVSLAHPERVAQRPSIGLAPLTPPVIKRLYELRAQYLQLANRVRYETADVEYANLPRVHSKITGNTFKNTQFPAVEIVDGFLK